MANKENINKLIAFMEEGTVPWNIKESATCFIGQVSVCFDTDTRDITEILGIATIEDADQLFTPAYHFFAPSFYPLGRAIAQLRYFRETGKVDWDATP